MCMNGVRVYTGHIITMSMIIIKLSIAAMPMPNRMTSGNNIEHAFFFSFIFHFPSFGIIMPGRRNKMTRHTEQRFTPSKSNRTSTKMKRNENTATHSPVRLNQSNKIKRKFNVIKTHIKLTTFSDETKERKKKTW